MCVYMCVCICVWQTAYRQDPPALLQLVQHNARLVRLNRVDVGGTAREAARKADHALRQPDLPQLLVLVVAQLLLARRPAAAALAAQPRPRPRRFGVVEDYLLVERLVRVAQRGVVDGQEAELRGDHAGDVCRAHGCTALLPWSLSRLCCLVSSSSSCGCGWCCVVLCCAVPCRVNVVCCLLVPSGRVVQVLT